MTRRGAEAAAISSFGSAPEGAAGTRFPAGRCLAWQVAWPQAHNCAQAAMLESSSDAVTQRVAAGILGLILLTGYRWSAAGHAAAARCSPR